MKLNDKYFIFKKGFKKLNLIVFKILFQTFNMNNVQREMF